MSRLDVTEIYNISTDVSLRNGLPISKTKKKKW